MDLEYEKFGFKCGIEIHQQLDTHKLFCSCPSLIREDAPDIVVERKMRAVAGELGEVDPAALHEFLKNRRLLYEAYNDTTCLVELDEEPPHPLNEEALKIALEAALLLKATPVDELQVMRKTVIDGSNTTGFQRTILVAINGILETSQGPIGIPTVCLEEDAARKIGEKGDTITYRLDRLGIPLVEVATTPDIKSPKHAREVAERIGMLLRATGKVKRGLGTIRQDLNVSVRGGARIEVKGVQTLNDIPKILENEVLRQLRLIEIKNELAVRKVAKDDLNGEFIDVTEIFAEHGKDWVKSKIKSGEKVFAVKLKGFSGLLGKELMPDYRFGTELARIAKSTTGLGGITHSDEKIDEILKEKVAAKLKAEGNAGFVSVVAEKETAERTLSILVKRCINALAGVPEETRMAVGELSEYMRPLPGLHRMYPETDEPLVLVKGELTKKIKSNLPELYEEKAKRYENMGLSSELAAQLSKSSMAGEFESYVKKHSKINASTIAAVLLMSPKEAKKRFNANIDLLQERHFEEILHLLDKGIITKNSVVELLAEASAKPDLKIEEIAKEKQLTTLGDKEIEEIVSKALIEGKSMAAGSRENAINMLTGRIMGQCKGRAEAEKVREILSKKLKE